VTDYESTYIAFLQDGRLFFGLLRKYPCIHTAFFGMVLGLHWFLDGVPQSGGLHHRCLRCVLSCLLAHIQFLLPLNRDISSIINMVSLAE
jgi:hypothetical protein